MLGRYCFWPFACFTGKP